MDNNSKPYKILATKYRPKILEELIEFNNRTIEMENNG